MPKFYKLLLLFQIFVCSDGKLLMLLFKCSNIILQIAHVIREIRLFQQTPYRIEHIPRVSKHFNFLSSLIKGWTCTWVLLITAVCIGPFVKFYHFHVFFLNHLTIWSQTLLVNSILSREEGIDKCWFSFILCKFRLWYKKVKEMDLKTPLLISE